ncbi:root hair defective 3-like protein [Tanacetum coccineum]
MGKMERPHIHIFMWLKAQLMLNVCRAIQRDYKLKEVQGIRVHLHLIDGDGTFNATGLDAFIKEVKLSECGLSYVVVSIIGPQSSGKEQRVLLIIFFSYQLQGTGCVQGKARHKQPKVLVGKIVLLWGIESLHYCNGSRGVSDRREQERWCHDIGREHAANKPLLKTVFQTPLEKFRAYLERRYSEGTTAARNVEEHQDTNVTRHKGSECVSIQVQLVQLKYVLLNVFQFNL